MNLAWKFLTVPLVTGALLMGIGGVATWAMRSERATLGELHTGIHAQADAAMRFDYTIVAMHAETYRVLGLPGDIKDRELKVARARLAGDTRKVAELLTWLQARQAFASPDEARTIRERADKYIKSLADCLDLAGVGATDVTAVMQAAEDEFIELSKVTHALTGRQQALAQQMYAGALEDERRGEWAIWIATALAMLVAGLSNLMLSRVVVRPVLQARGFAARIADGDLTGKLPAQSGDEIGGLIGELGNMSGNLARVVASITSANREVQSAATDIAGGNSDLSGRTEAAGASLQQTAASLADLTRTVKSNADSAREANRLSLEASDVARRGGTVVGEVIETMARISDSSGRIADIIGVIDGMAFQTNILALNAAVEAARAGGQGRGFAVVAGEVRSLAQRSAEAAAQIKQLIARSAAEVESGSSRVRDAGATMKEVMHSVEQVTDIMGAISAATDQQSSQISQVNAAVVQLDQMTRQNASLVDHSAAAAERLREQSRLLSESVAQFKLDSDYDPHSTRSTKPILNVGAAPVAAPPPAAMAVPTTRVDVLFARPAPRAKPASPEKPALLAKPASITRPAQAVAPDANAFWPPANARSTPALADEAWETF